VVVLNYQIAILGAESAFEVLKLGQFNDQPLNVAV
jgi:hypothetical protein